MVYSVLRFGVIGEFVLVQSVLEGPIGKPEKASSPGNHSSTLLHGPRQKVFFQFFQIKPAIGQINSCIWIGSGERMENLLGQVRFLNNLERNAVLPRPSKKVLLRALIVASVRLPAFAESRIRRRVIELVVHLCDFSRSKVRKRHFTLFPPRLDDLHRFLTFLPV